MEAHRQKSSSGEIFSFPSTPNQEQDSDFQFGCFTLDSPSQDPHRDSPADHLFFNGRLLPHAFPLQPTTMTLLMNNASRATSRTSSVGSKDSLMSSRSNSSNSRSSSCSSARTSSSDNSERRLLYHSRVVSRNATMASKLVTAQLYGSSQRWQYITPVPAGALKRDVSKRKHNNGVAAVKEELMVRSRRQGEKKCPSRAKPGPCTRFLRSVLSACKECHAMEPSRTDVVLQAKLSSQ